MSRKSENLSSPTLGKIVEKRIFLIRDQRVILSHDLADLYQVELRALTQAVKRNLRRFPMDFMFRLTGIEWANLKSQIVISSSGHGGARHAPYAFSEQGVAMLSSILRSPTAIDVNIEIMRTFVRFRELASTNSQILKKVEAIEKRVTSHDTQLQQVFQAIRDLIQPAYNTRQPIGIKHGK
jgi:hypothetical protein